MRAPVVPPSPSSVEHLSEPVPKAPEGQRSGIKETFGGLFRELGAKVRAKTKDARNLVGSRKRLVEERGAEVGFRPPVEELSAIEGKIDDAGSEFQVEAAQIAGEKPAEAEVKVHEKTTEEIAKELDKRLGSKEASDAWHYREEVRAKYHLPECGYRWEDPERYIQEMENFVNENGITLRYKHEFEKFFEDFPDTQGRTTKDNEVVTTAVGHSDWLALRARAKQLSHEVVHAMQAKLYPGMPDEIAEKEAYYYQIITPQDLKRAMTSLDPALTFKTSMRIINESIESSVKTENELKNKAEAGELVGRAIVSPVLETAQPIKEKETVEGGKEKIVWRVKEGSFEDYLKIYKPSKEDVENLRVVFESAFNEGQKMLVSMDPETGEPAGYILYQRLKNHPEIVKIDSFGTNQDQRSKGAGQVLVEQLKEDPATRSIVAYSSPGAIKNYREYGFKEANYFGTGGNVYNMEWNRRGLKQREKMKELEVRS